jgi:Protein of unknown function (DUF2946)
MINRSLLSLLFAFLLTFAQQLALTHPYEHTADWQQKSSSQKNTLPHSDNCGKCIALAGVVSAVGSKAPTIPVLNASFELTAFATLPIISAHFQPYQSRAPPYLA